MPAGPDVALLSRKVYADESEAEARIIAFSPLKVIDQTPEVIALHRNTLANRLPELMQVADQETWTVLVCFVRDAVFSDIQGNAILIPQAAQRIEHALWVNFTPLA